MKNARFVILLAKIQKKWQKQLFWQKNAIG